MEVCSPADSGLNRWPPFCIRFSLHCLFPRPIDKNAQGLQEIHLVAFAHPDVYYLKLLYPFMPMLAPATPNTSLFTAYDRSGKMPSLLRSEPAQRIATNGDKGSTSTDNYKDKVTLSEAAVEKSRRGETTGTEEASTTADTRPEEQAGGQRPETQERTAAEEKIVRQLQERDREVKAHERAHLAGAGQYARGSAAYSFQQGPDGRRYAVGGEVAIDISKEKTPEETRQKMQTVKRAALAPAEPSSADRSIAASAAALESQARQEIQRELASSAQGPTEQQGHPETSNEVYRNTSTIKQMQPPAAASPWTLLPERLSPHLPSLTDTESDDAKKRLP
jgi:hypothetical protein